MSRQLLYIDAIAEDAELLSLTAKSSKKIWGYSDELMLLWKEDLEVAKDYIFENKVVKVYNLEKYVGFFAVKSLENENAEIDHLWITPKNVKQNYGREIFQFIKSYVASIGSKKLTVIAEPNAKGFYEKMGGKIIGRFESIINGRFLDIYEFSIYNEATTANIG
jgi:GNAT superfamily N-acetyltransferase